MLRQRAAQAGRTQGRQWGQPDARAAPAPVWPGVVAAFSAVPAEGRGVQEVAARVKAARVVVVQGKEALLEVARVKVVVVVNAQ
ncbi:hypothetical protein WCLP8_1520002 [uncultured Gammaproteobacteria bacterium]